MNEEDITGLAWWARDRVRGFMTGLHKSPDFGFSLDFAQHRAYVPGDAPKFIDWSVVARQDKYLTKQYEAESNLRAYFLLDSSASMHGIDGSKWDHAVRLIALSAALLSSQRDALGLLDVRESGEFFFEAKNTSDALEQLLFHVEKGMDLGTSNGNLLLGMDRLISEIPKRSEVLLFSDTSIEDIASVCQKLGMFKDAGHHIRWVVLLDVEKELKSKFYSGKWVRDAETDQKVHLTEADVQQMNAFHKSQIALLEAGSIQYGFELVLLDTNEDVLLNFHRLIS